MHLNLGRHWFSITRLNGPPNRSGHSGKQNNFCHLKLDQRCNLYLAQRHLLTQLHDSKLVALNNSAVSESEKQKCVNPILLYLIGHNFSWNFKFFKNQVSVKSKYCPSVAGPKIKTYLGYIWPKR